MHMCMQAGFFHTGMMHIYGVYMSMCCVSGILSHPLGFSELFLGTKYLEEPRTQVHNTDVVLSLLSLHSRRIYFGIFWRKECGLWKNNYIIYPNILLTNSLLFETGSHYDTQSGLELTIQLRLALSLWFSLPQPFRCWDYKYTRVNGHFNFWNINEKACALLFLGVQRIELRSSHMLGNS